MLFRIHWLLVRQHLLLKLSAASLGHIHQYARQLCALRPLPFLLADRQFTTQPLRLCPQFRLLCFLKALRRLQGLCLRSLIFQVSPSRTNLLSLQCPLSMNPPVSKSQLAPRQQLYLVLFPSQVYHRDRLQNRHLGLSRLQRKHPHSQQLRTLTTRHPYDALRHSVPIVLFPSRVASSAQQVNASIPPVSNAITAASTSNV